MSAVELPIFRHDLDMLTGLPLMPAFLFLVFCVPAIAYYSYGTYAAIAFFAHPTTVDPTFQPAVTILKPICGLDNDSYANFASFCQQDYPQYQIVFGVRDAQDPCIAVVQQIMQDFPTVDIQLVVSDRTLGSNYKVSNLDNAATKAKYDYLVLADSDVRVDPTYLRRILQPMRDDKVGVVTCLYRPITRGWVANFEAVGISTEYLASVLVANQLEGMAFALGPTIVLRREVLEKIGGFAAIADYLADDFQLGYRPTQVGYRVVLSDYVIDHMITTDSFSDLIRRQIRWACCTRVSRFWGYVGLVFTYGTATSLLVLLLSQGSFWAWVGLSLTWAARLLMAWTVGVVKLKDQSAWKFLWLIPLRDLISFVIWCYCFFGNRILWRGRPMGLTQGGKLVPLPH